MERNQSVQCMHNALDRAAWQVPGKAFKFTVRELPGSAGEASKIMIETRKIGFLGMLCLFSALAFAQTQTLVQHQLAGDATCKSSLTCTVTLNAPTVAGHVLMLGVAGASGYTTFPAVTSVSGDSTWVHAPACYGTLSQPDYTFTDCWYILSAAGGASTITVTIAGQGLSGDDIWNFDVEVMDVSCAGCTAAFDTANFTTVSSCTTCTGETLQLSGTDDAILQIANFYNAYGSLASPYALLDDDATSGNAFSYGLNAISGVAPVWGQPGGQSLLAAGLAIKFSLSAQVDPPAIPTNITVTVQP